MYRMLIVDDEPIITDGLFEVFKTGIDYELDLYKAYSGDEALEWLNRTRVDIVLSDIRMPGMDGLQLLERIRCNWPDCKVIFLTGYNEFDYVYKAIQYSGVNYLLKTEGHDKIIEAVKKCIGEIEDNRKLEHLIGQAKEFSDKAEYLSQRDFFIQMLQYNEFEVVTEQQLNELGILMKTGYPVMMLLGRMTEASSDCLYSERIHEANMVRLITDGYFHNNVSSFCINITTNEFLWLIQPIHMVMESDDDLLHARDRVDLFISGTLEVIQDVCVKTLNKKISFVFANNTILWTELNSEYHKLRQIFDRHITDAGKEIIISKNNYSDPNEQVIQQNENIKQSYQKLKELEAMALCLERGNKADFFGYLQELTSGLNDINSLHNNMAIEIYMSVALMLLSYINTHNLTDKLAFRIGLNKLTRLNEHNSWQEAISYITELVGILFEYQVIEHETNENAIVIKVQNFIEENISKDVSMVRLAELVHFNPTYLSRLFKLKKGITLSDYIDDIRVEKAKRYLSSGEYKILEIAELIGYESSTNFGRFFKKKTGTTPQEYRESVINRNIVNESR